MSMSLIKIVKARSGLTLVEIMVALLVLSVGIFGYLTVATVSIKANMTSFDTAVAKSLAENKITKLKYLSYSDVDLTHTGDIKTIIPKDGISGTEQNLITNNGTWPSRYEKEINYKALTAIQDPDNGPYKYTRYYVVCIRDKAASPDLHCPNSFPYDEGIAGEKIVVVTVIWRGENQRSRYISISSLIPEL
ncbi:MAG: prepilin-type N-terminal cleavage/methylation domain-containing protein [Pseudomonadota bacterium]